MFSLYSSEVRTGFEKACRRAEIEGLIFHDIRGTFGTRLLKRDVDIIIIQRLYGHSSVLITQKYLHPEDELAQEAIECLVDAAKRPENLAPIGHQTPAPEQRSPANRSFSVH